MYNVDSSDFLETLSPSYEHILGELQYSFTAFLVGNSYEGLLQWKCLIDMIMRADRLLTASRKHPAQTLFLHKALIVILQQLKDVPKDFFVDALSKDNFMKKSLRSLMQTVRDINTGEGNTDADSTIVSLLIQIRDFCSEYFIWDFDITEVRNYNC